MAESEKTDLELQVSFEESDSDSSFEVIEDPENPRVSTMILILGCASSAQPHKLASFASFSVLTLGVSPSLVSRWREVYSLWGT